MAMAPPPMMAMMAAPMMSRAMAPPMEEMKEERAMRRAAPKKMAIRFMARDEDDECEEAFAPASM